MTSLPETRSSIDLHLLAEASLKNEEIVELVAFIAAAESVAPFHEHLQLLRDRYDMTLEMRSLEVEVLSIRNKFDTRVLRNFYLALEDQGYHSLIKPAMVGYQEDKNAAVYMTTLEKVFAIQPDERFIRDLLDFIDNSNMVGTGTNAIRKHYQHQLDRIASYAPIPAYVQDFGIKVNELPHLEEREVSADLPAEFIADYLLTQVGNMDLYIEETEETSAKDVLVGYINRMSDEEREQFVNLFKIDDREVQDLRDNRDVFRVYGPVNPFADTDFSKLRNEEGELDVNIIFGGARMFTDLSLESDHDNDLPVDDWFVGHCLQCSARIRSYHHAVREPWITGGWRGCYCDWKCVREFIELDTEPDPDLYNEYVTKIALTREYEERMNEIGIQDRDYDIKKDLNEEGYDAEHVDQDIVDELTKNLPQIDFGVPPVIDIPVDFGEGTAET